MAEDFMTAGQGQNEPPTPPADAGQGAAPVPPAPPQAQGAVPPSDPQFDPKQWGLEHKGQKIYPKDRNEFVSWASRGRDYSQRMAELNKKQAEFDQLGQRYQKYQELEERLEADPNFRDFYVNKLMGYKGPSGEEQGQDPYAPVISEQTQKIQKLESMVNTFLSQNADARLEKEENALRSKYSDVPWDQDNGEGSLMSRVGKFALENKIYNLEHAYKLLDHDGIVERNRIKALEDYKNQTQQNHKNGKVVLDGKQDPSNGNGKPVRGGNWADVQNRVLEQLKIA